MSNPNGTKFAEGELVNVSIRGARVVDGALYELSLDLDTDTVIDLPWPHRTITVERVAPAEWPPQPGDVWEDRNRAKWFGTERGDGVRLTSASGDTWSDFGEVLGTVGPMRLLYRDGWTPATETTPAEAEPAHQPVDRRAALVASLRAGADWIERHTELPVTDWRDRAPMYCCGSEAELERIAAQLGVPVKVEDHSGHLRITVPVDGVTYDAFRVPEQRKPAQWLEMYHPGVTILDYDGWRDERFDSVMTWHEFERRLSVCTVTTQPAAVQPDEPADDPAETDPEAPVPAPAVETPGLYAPAERCPRCESPAPNLHPAVQHEGEVQPCPDPWHAADLPHRTPDADAASLLAESLADGAA